MRSVLAKRTEMRKSLSLTPTIATGPASTVATRSPLDDATWATLVDVLFEFFAERPRLCVQFLPAEGGIERFRIHVAVVTLVPRETVVSLEHTEASQIVLPTVPRGEIE